MTKIDKSKLRKVPESEYSPAFPKETQGVKSNTSIKTKKKGLKKSKLQKKKDNCRSKYWKTKAMAMWGKYQHHMHRNCLVCGTANNLQAHHLVGRANVLFRNHPENIAMLCPTHHNWDTEISAHMAPLGFVRFLEKNHPDKIEFIEECKGATGKPNYQEDYELLKVLYLEAGGNVENT